MSKVWPLILLVAALTFSGCIDGFDVPSMASDGGDESGENGDTDVTESSDETPTPPAPQVVFTRSGSGNNSVLTVQSVSGSADWSDLNGATDRDDCRSVQPASGNVQAGQTITFDGTTCSGATFVMLHVPSNQIVGRVTLGTTDPEPSDDEEPPQVVFTKSGSGSNAVLTVQMTSESALWEEFDSRFSQAGCAVTPESRLDNESYDSDPVTAGQTVTFDGSCSGVTFEMVHTATNQISGRSTL